MFARLYNAPWSRTGRDRTVAPMSAIVSALESAATSAARTDFRFIKRGALQLPGVASSQDYRANYLIYSNDDVHFFGAWIDSVEWASSNSFVVRFTDDNFTTFAAGAIINGYVTRKNYTVPSGEALGDHISGDRAVAALWSMRLDALGANAIIVYWGGDVTPAQFYRPRGTVQTPFIPILLEDSTDRDKFKNLIQNTNFKPEMIIAAYVVPPAMLTGITTGTFTVNQIFGQDITFKFITDSAIYQTTFDAFANITDPILLNSGDAELVVRVGKSANRIPIESIADGVFTIKVALTPSPVISIRPNWRKTQSLALRTDLPEYAYSDFPQISFTENAFNQWAIKNALPAVASILGGAVVGGAGGALVGAAGISRQFLNTPMAGLTPSYSPGATSSLDAVAGASVGIQLMLPADRQRALDFYAQFGYPCGHRERFALIPGNTPQFWQSTDNVIDGEMPAAAKDEIDNMLKAGVRVWNTTAIGDYT